MNQKIVLAISIVVGALAFLLTVKYLNSKETEFKRRVQELYKGAKKISVVIAKADIPQGAVLTKDDLAKKEIFEIETTIRGHAVTPQEAELILGRKTLFKINVGEPIFWSDIEGGGQSGGGLSSAVKPGLRAISISVGGAAAVSSMVEPNDRVDVLGTFSFPSKTHPEEMEVATLTLLQDVTVLATGQTVANQRVLERTRARSYSEITLEATPRECELLVFSQQMKGRLYLSLRNPADVTFEADLPEINFEHLETSLPELNGYRQRVIRHRKNF
ncbi:MAG: Flp pilus assembly protein CpaB [Verrucomicrobia bacterium]|nr:Flp pilus assembly protein CpaB [Verrucomicrobiota bacterium]